VLNTQTKMKLDEILKEVRKTIGLKKKEINWGQVAAVVLGIAAVGAGAEYMGGLQEGESIPTDAGSGEVAGSDSAKSPFWEDRMAEMSAKYGGGLNFYHPVQY
jgi:hypothetical protein